jgi:hypothetical protein
VPLRGHHHINISAARALIDLSTLRPTPRVHHVARPSFSFPSVSFCALPCSYCNRRLPSVACWKRGCNNNNASFSLCAPSITRTGILHYLSFSTLFRSTITPTASGPTLSEIQILNLCAQVPRPRVFPHIRPNHLQPCLLSPECVLVHFFPSHTFPSLMRDVSVPSFLRCFTLLRAASGKWQSHLSWRSQKSGL